MYEELSNYKSPLVTDIKVTEIKINLPCGGFIAGKWWGSLDKKPILCFHGWQDNAGTYDRLIPLLPREFSFLAIDFPGHGRSSWFPDGVTYHASDNLFSILHVMRAYNWDKISIIGHSMGAMIGFMFAALFPDKMELLIKIDSFKNLDRTFEQEQKDTREIMLNYMISDERIRSNSEPPSYTIDEMIERVNTGSFYNITKESAPYLLERNITRSSKLPSKFYFSRDPRLKNIMLLPPSKDAALGMAKIINEIPFLFFTTKVSSPLYAKLSYLEELIEEFKKNQKFRLEVIDSDSHYFHLNDPHSVSKAISEFLVQNNKIGHHL